MAGTRQLLTLVIQQYLDLTGPSSANSLGFMQTLVDEVLRTETLPLLQAVARPISLTAALQLAVSISDHMQGQQTANEIACYVYALLQLKLHVIPMLMLPYEEPTVIAPTPKRPRPAPIVFDTDEE